MFIDFAYGFDSSCIGTFRGVTSYMHGCNTTMEGCRLSVQHHTWRGIRQHPKGSLAFMGIKHP